MRLAVTGPKRSEQNDQASALDCGYPVEGTACLYLKGLHSLVLLALSPLMLCPVTHPCPSQPTGRPFSAAQFLHKCLCPLCKGPLQRSKNPCHLRSALSWQLGDGAWFSVLTSAIPRWVRKTLAPRRWAWGCPSWLWTTQPGYRYRPWAAADLIQETRSLSELLAPRCLPHWLWTSLGEVPVRSRCSRAVLAQPGDE